jgi:hypothetical protein
LRFCSLFTSFPSEGFGSSVWSFFSEEREREKEQASRERKDRHREREKTGTERKRKKNAPDFKTHPIFNLPSPAPLACAAHHFCKPTFLEKMNAYRYRKNKKNGARVGGRARLKNQIFKKKRKNSKY